MRQLKYIFSIFVLFSNLYSLDSLKIQPKDSFDLNEIDKISKDSLVLATCSDFVYFPFGEIQNKSELKKSSLKIFSIHSKMVNQKNGIFQYQLLDYKSSKLILFFDSDSESTISSYIMRGEIKDSSILLLNNISIGMTVETFLTRFFISFPKKQYFNPKVIIFEPCVAGTRHIYNFENGKLKLIQFDDPYSHWKF